MSYLLLVVPDYVSHYLPMSAVAKEMAQAGHRVVVASGPAIRPMAAADGFETEDLVLGPGSNPGLVRADEQQSDEAAQLRSFFAASALGPIPTLLHQASNRLNDLLWDPHGVAAQFSRILTVKPDLVLVDQLAYGATAALRGLGIDFVSFHPGHPSAISKDTPYGMPARMPARFSVDPKDMSELRQLCLDVVERFTDRYNEVVASLDGGTDRLEDAFTATGSMNFINYPSELGSGYNLPLTSRFIGSSWREETMPATLSMRLARRAKRPRVYVSLGSFFSARGDILRRLADAFRNEPVDVVMATGITPIEEIGDIPDQWTLAPYFPQTAVLQRCDLVVTHGGNNTVTEALTVGIPLLVGPLSTDQFGGAADVEEAGLGLAFDPNFDLSSTIADMAHEIVQGDHRERAEAMGFELRSRPGARVAASLLESTLESTDTDLSVAMTG